MFVLHLCVNTKETKGAAEIKPIELSVLSFQKNILKYKANDE
jgi:hypothetical protein